MMMSNQWGFDVRLDKQDSLILAWGGEDFWKRNPGYGANKLLRA